MKLKELINDIDIKNKYNLEINENLEISDINFDSREVSDNGVFVAIPGFATDGHKFIDSAIKNGAKVILCEYLPEDLKDDVTYLEVDDSRALLGILASKFYDEPSKKMLTIGVTGTNGKTSTVSLVNDIFNKAGITCGLSTTIHNMIGDKVYDNKGRTTPESKDLQKFLSEMVKNNCKAASIECSSHALELNRLGGTDFDYGIFTNLSHDHLDFHNNMESYFNSKKKLFETTNKANIINIDNEWGQKLYDLLKEEDRIPVYSYGFNSNADFNLDITNETVDGVEFKVTTPDDSFSVHIPLIGQEMASNTLAAMIPAILEGVNKETIKEAVSHPNSIDGRLEKLEIDAPFDILIDYAHTPDALERLLNTAKRIHNNNLIVVFGAGGDRDKTKRSEMGEVAGRIADKVVISSDNPRSEDPISIIEDILKGIETTDADYEVIPDRREAIKYSIETAQPGDIIVLAGKGHEKTEVINGQTIELDEHKIVDEILKSIQN